MKKYLSIGEVSKLKNISVKSLRYYAKLGILIPAYINPHTGYRYYTMKQMVIVDLIYICLELNIPLKNFHNYIDENGAISMDKILEDGKKIADEKVARLNLTINKLENISKHVFISKQIKKNKGEYLHYFDERYLIVTKWNGDISDVRSLMGATTKLYQLCESLPINYLYNQGVLYQYVDDRIEHFVFIEVSKPVVETEQLMIMPAGTYQCEVFPNERIADAEKKYIKDKSYANGSFVLGRELYDSKVKSEPSPVEMQVFIP